MRCILAYVDVATVGQRGPVESWQRPPQSEHPGPSGLTIKADPWPRNTFMFTFQTSSALLKHQSILIWVPVVRLRVSWGLVAGVLSVGGFGGREVHPRCRLPPVCQPANTHCIMISTHCSWSFWLWNANMSFDVSWTCYSWRLLLDIRAKETGLRFNITGGIGLNGRILRNAATTRSITSCRDID